MSNRRRPTPGTPYRHGFLSSPAWHARRARWFTKQQRIAPLACKACGIAATASCLELHHLNYDGVTYVDGSWRAFEKHADLLPLHPYCHDLLHRLIDRDDVLAHGRDRATATAIALEHLRFALRGVRENA